MKTIAVVDTAISTDNLGDEIIMDAVNRVIDELFHTAYVFRVPSHDRLSDRTRKYIGQASIVFIGGTNLLSSDIHPKSLWRLSRNDARIYGANNTVCLGTGWNDYMAEPSPRTKWILQTALSANVIHSVRDDYTREHLASVGRSAVTTSCPSTWFLTPEHCNGIPQSCASNVVFTLTAWRPDAAADRGFVELLRKHYSVCYFFPQMQDDWEYFRSFGWEDIRVVTPTTAGYTHFLENEDVDFVGTRLHGGIRALQKRRRALILAIDNRATEIGRDIGLPVVARTNRQAIQDWIVGCAPTTIKLPTDAIEAWKAQFKPALLRRLPAPASVSNIAQRGIRTIDIVRDALGI